MKNTNTILIIGNGFDIAHGMKTSYKNILFAIMRELSTWRQDIEFTQHEQFNVLASNFDGNMVKKIFDAYKSDWEVNHLRKIKDFSVNYMNGELVVAYQYARNFMVEYGN